MRASDLQVNQLYTVYYSRSRADQVIAIIRIDKKTNDKIYWRDIFRRNAGSVKLSASTMLTKNADDLNDKEIKTIVFNNIFENPLIYMK